MSNDYDYSKIGRMIEEFPVLTLTRDEIQMKWPDMDTFVYTLTDDQMQTIARGLGERLSEFLTEALKETISHLYPEAQDLMEVSTDDDFNDHDETIRDMDDPGN